MPTRTESWAITRFKKSTRSFTWSIKNYSCLQHRKPSEQLDSPIFSLTDGSKWRLRLYPSGINDSFADSLSVYLSRVSGVGVAGGLVVDGHFSLSLVGEEARGKILEKRDRLDRGDKFSSWGFPDFVGSQALRDDPEAMTPADSLTLLCELTTIAGCESFSSEDVPLSTTTTTTTTSGLAVDLEKLLLQPRFSDVKLVSPCGAELPAHKNILAARSPTFAAMFEHDMRESRSNRVEIADVEHEVLKELLRYLYTGRVADVSSLAGELVAAADKYAVDGLRDRCEEALCAALAADNALETLELADRHSMPKLKERAMLFARAHIGEIVRSEAFEQSSGGGGTSIGTPTVSTMLEIVKSLV